MITLSVRAARPALKQLMPIIPPRSMDSASYVRVASAGRQINMRATDGDLEVTVGVSGQASEPGVFLVPARPLKRLVTSLDPELPITFRRTRTGDRVEVACLGTTLSYPWMKEEEFPPSLSVGDKPRRHMLDLNAIGSVLDACPETHARPICGVRVEGRYYVATDLYRLYVTSSPVGRSEMSNPFRVPDLFIPRRAAVLLAKVGGIRSVSVGTDPNDADVLALHSEGRSIKTVLADSSDYVDWRRIPPLHKVPEALILGPGFVEAFRHMLAMADAAHCNSAVTFPEGSPIAAFMRRGDDNFPDALRGNVTSTFPGESHFTLSYNPRFLLQALRGAKTDRILCEGTPHPAIITWDENNYRYTRYLMPVRT